MNNDMTNETAVNECVFVKQIADELGIDEAEASEHFARLASAAHGTAFEGDGVRDLFIVAMEAARASLIPPSDLRNFMINISQMVSNRVVCMDDMRQLSSSCIPGRRKPRVCVMPLPICARNS